MKKGSVLISSSMLLLSVLTTTVSMSAAADVIRHPLPNNSKFPIASAVEVPAGNSIVFQSGTVPGPANADAEQGTPAYFGDTKAQTISVFERIKVNLKRQGMEMGDIVKLTVFLVGDPAMDGKMDFGGFMEAYTMYFGTKEQPNLPARSAVQVAGLVRPLMFVEIEAITVRKDKMM
jgi:enamine deaminase RidA (YjgF/YER057c/UK114 family)